MEDTCETLPPKGIQEWEGIPHSLCEDTVKDPRGLALVCPLSFSPATFASPLELPGSQDPRRAKSTVQLHQALSAVVFDFFLSICMQQKGSNTHRAALIRRPLLSLQVPAGFAEPWLKPALMVPVLSDSACVASAELTAG